MQPLASAPILVDQVYQSLVAAIADRSLPPGQRIRQGELAASLGVSRQPVSHALQLLKHQGLVQESGRQGLEVAPMDPDRIRHLYRVRSALDDLAARLAAERARNGALGAGETVQFREIVDRGAAFCADVALATLVEADVAFHQSLYRLSGNPVILELVAPQWPHLRRSMLTVLEAEPYRARAWREHAEIARLVLAGLPDEAGAAARAHAEQAGRETAHRLGGT